MKREMRWMYVPYRLRRRVWWWAYRRWVRDTSDLEGQPNPGLVCEVTLTPSLARFSEPIRMRKLVINRSLRPMMLGPVGFSMRLRTPDGRIIDPSGGTSPYYRPPSREDFAKLGRKRFIGLETILRLPELEEKHAYWVVLSDAAEGDPLRPLSPGRYSLLVEARFTATGAEFGYAAWTGKIEAAEVAFTIEPDVPPR